MVAEPENPTAQPPDGGSTREPGYRENEKLRWPQMALYLVGLPVETRQTILIRPPWVTRFLVLFIALTSVAYWISYQGDATPWLHGLIFWPEADLGARLLGSFTYPFLHLDWIHLLGNLYFLLIFGDNIECRFGRRRMLGLFFSASILGAVLHGAFDHKGLVGASGGMFGLLVFYILQFPKARVLWLPFGFVGRLLFLLFGWKWVQRGLSVGWFFAIYGGLQLFVLYDQLFLKGNVSALAHLGGGLAGLIIWWAWRRGWLP